MNALPKFGSQKPDETARIVDTINAMTEDDLNRLDAWQGLSDLSSSTIFEAIDADPESVVIDSAGNFEAIASVYVTLVYGSSKDQETMSDEYLATLGGVYTDDGAIVSKVDVDTSSFYE